MPDDGRDAGVVEIARDEDGGVGIGVVVPQDQLEPRPLMPPVALISSAASSAACRMGRPIGSLNGAGHADPDRSGSAVGAPDAAAAATSRSDDAGRK